MTLENLKRALAAWKEAGNEEKIKHYEALLEKKLKKIKLYSNNPASNLYKYRDIVEKEEPKPKPKKEVKESGKNTEG